MPNLFYSVEELLKKLGPLRENKKLVFTNGCFDILHPGHVKVVNSAAALGDILVIGLNSDSSVKKLKGPSRPIINEQDRARMLLALKGVDFVIIFKEETPLELIKAIRPDVLMKGSEYTIDKIVGEEYSGETVRVKMEKGLSTSSIIERILKQC
ncbi:MAG: adenylyltransferase/cytidyltransferase family protein [Elusimicrobia bacterium]|nr:adenylyltransferase/cytidyltransferase family protein [Elusimicrobiota bacterium]